MMEIGYSRALQAKSLCGNFGDSAFSLQKLVGGRE